MSSGYAKLLILLLFVALVAGFYFMAHTIDLYRQRQETVALELREVRSELGRIHQSLEGLKTSGVVDRADRPASTKSRLAKPGFGNLAARDPDAEEGGHLVLVAMLEMQNMNYLATGGWDVRKYWWWTFDALAQRNLEDPTRFEPMLAERWETSEDKKTYTIHLRQGVLWHDFTDPTTGQRFEGVEVTSEDFKFYLDVLRMPQIAAAEIREYYNEVDRIEIIDRYQFKVHWRRAMVISEQFTLELQPLPRHFYDFDTPDQFINNTERNRMIVGCGPWVLEKWEKGKGLVFRRNEAYHGPKPYLRKIRIKVIREMNAVFQALENGEIDMASIDGIRWLQKADDEEFKKQFHMIRTPVAAAWTIIYNQRKDLFDDQRVRVALTHLTNRPRILNEVYYGLGRLVWNPFLVHSPNYNPSITPYPFDIEAGKQLLAEAGWRDTDDDGILDKDGKKFAFNFMTLPSSNITQAKVAAILREDFAKAGIVVDIDSFEWSVFQQRADTRSFDAFMGGFRADGMRSEWEVDPYLYYHSTAADTAGTQNISGFNSAEVDQILDQARQEFDSNKRIELYHELCRICHEQQPRTILLTPDELLLVSRRFRNVKGYPLGPHIHTFWVPRNEQRY